MAASREFISCSQKGVLVHEWLVRILSVEVTAVSACSCPAVVEVSPKAQDEEKRGEAVVSDFWCC